MIGIVNYGMGNLASVKNAFDFLDIKSRIISDPIELEVVDKILLPGVGAFGMAMDNLSKTGFRHAIQELVLEKKKPILGVCLGMQLLFESSTEHGNHTGLQIIKGKVSFFGNVISKLPIPHMGWNNVEYTGGARLFKNIAQSESYYFVHSYYCEVSSGDQIAGTTNYGVDFHSSVENDHVFGCQFHPEKSQKNGLTVYKNFNYL